MIFNPVLSSLKFMHLFLRGKVKLHHKSNNKIITVHGKEYIIFRHITIKEPIENENSVVLTLRFKFKHASLKKDRRDSFFQIPVFAGLPGFQGKFWTFDEKRGIFQGIYQWKSEAHVKGYLNSFAVEFVKNKTADHSVESEIYRNSSLDDFTMLNAYEL